MIRRDAPYTEVLTTKRAEMNGQIAHYLLHQSRLSLDVYGDPDPGAPD